MSQETPQTSPVAGFRTSEFWVILIKLIAGIAMVFNADTREIGLLLLGASGTEGAQYTRSRTAAKLVR